MKRLSDGAGVSFIAAGLLTAVTSLTVGGIMPAHAQMDQQWRLQEAGGTECQQKWRDAQYSNESSHLEKRYFITNQKRVWQILNVSNCIDQEIGSVDITRQKHVSDDYPYDFRLVLKNILIKIEGSNLVKYQGSILMPKSNVRRIILGVLQ